MILIPLTQGYFAQIDDSDYEEVSKYKWRASVTKTTVYARGTTRGSHTNRTSILMHRLILDILDSKEQGEHKDHNGLNNQRSNIRISTQSENMANRAKRSGKSSKYLGVCWNKRLNKWEARIGKNRILRHLGYFSDEQSAAKAYNDATLISYGEFATINTI